MDRRVGRLGADGKGAGVFGGLGEMVHKRSDAITRERERKRETDGLLAL